MGPFGLRIDKTGEDKITISRRAIIAGAVSVAAVGKARAMPRPRERVEEHLAGLIEAMTALHGGKWRGCINPGATMVIVLSDD